MIQQERKQRRGQEAGGGEGGKTGSSQGIVSCGRNEETVVLVLVDKHVLNRTGEKSVWSPGMGWRRSFAVEWSEVTAFKWVSVKVV